MPQNNKKQSLNDGDEGGGRAHTKTKKAKKKKDPEANISDKKAKRNICYWLRKYLQIVKKYLH